MFERYSALARQAVFVARLEAGHSRREAIHSEHLLIGLLVAHPELFKQLGVIIEPDELRTQIEQWHPPSTPIPTNQDLPLSPNLMSALEQAPAIADEQHCTQIRTEHLLLSMFEQPCHAAQFLNDRGISRDRLSTLVTSADCNTPQMPTASSNETMRLIIERLMP